MDNDPNEHYIRIDGYFDGLAQQIDELDPKSIDFDFVIVNIRAALQHSPFLKQAEKAQLRQLLHISLSNKSLG